MFDDDFFDARDAGVDPRPLHGDLGDLADPVEFPDWSETTFEFLAWCAEDVMLEAELEDANNAS